MLLSSCGKNPVHQPIKLLPPFLVFPYVLLSEVSQVLFRLSRWENLEHAKEI